MSWLLLVLPCPRIVRTVYIISYIEVEIILRQLLDLFDGKSPLSTQVLLMQKEIAHGVDALTLGGGKRTADHVSHLRNNVLVRRD